MRALIAMVVETARRYYGRTDSWALREAAKHIASRALMRGRVKVLAGALTLQTIYRE